MWMLAVLMVLILIGCRTVKYVPVEKVKVEKREVHDTVHKVDTVTKERKTIVRKATAEDSARLAAIGLKLHKTEEAYLVLMKERESEKHEKEHLHVVRDTVRDSVPVPSPPVIKEVERELTWWEKARIMIGNIVIGGLVISIVVYFVKKKFT